MTLTGLHDDIRTDPLLPTGRPTETLRMTEAGGGHSVGDAVCEQLSTERCFELRSWPVYQGKIEESAVTKLHPT
jgi:hypothetical protein